MTTKTRMIIYTRTLEVDFVQNDIIIGIIIVINCVISLERVYFNGNFKIIMPYKGHVNCQM